MIFKMLWFKKWVCILITLDRQIMCIIINHHVKNSNPNVNPMLFLTPVIKCDIYRHGTCPWIRGLFANIKFEKKVFFFLFLFNKTPFCITLLHCLTRTYFLVKIALKILQPHKRPLFYSSLAIYLCQGGYTYMTIFNLPDLRQPYSFFFGAFVNADTICMSLDP